MANASIVIENCNIVVVDLEYVLLWMLSMCRLLRFAHTLKVEPTGFHSDRRKQTIDYDQETQHVQITDQPMAPRERNTRNIGARTRTERETYI